MNILHILPCALTGASVGLLALGMQRHHARVFGKAATLTQPRFLRACGWSLLLVSLLLSVIPWSGGWNGGKGLVAWSALLILHAFVFTLGITYRPKWTPWWTTALGALTLLMLAFNTVT